MAFLVTFSFVCLAHAFVNNDFSVVYVAQHSNSLLPLQYRIAAVWGGHEGSLLLWMLMLTWWAFGVAMLSRQLPDTMVARVLGTLGLVAFGFMLFILFTSNPFDRLLPGALEGKDLNPLLQDFGLVIHPPLLYMGYVGYWFPGIFHFLFPEGSLVNLQFMSQIGLMLFMFVVGMELDLKVLSKRAQDAVVISHASIVVPYALGVGLAYFLYLDFAPPTISFSSFALFMGIAMSITAFPVLARIIQERGLSGTRIGTVAIACAAADDVTAWCILAAVIAIVKAGSAASALFTIGASLLYVLLMIRVVRPFLVRLGDIHKDRESISRPIVALLFLVLFGSAYITEMIGIHALFGAFLAGAIMPPALTFRKVMINKMEDISLVLLLPLFFVFTGLRTRIGLLDSVDLWLVCGAVVGVAVLGKFGGSALAARFTGNSWKDSLSIGALMNTRGLMELIVLNIGYDLGVLTPKIFVMMVLMALVTTFMTGPLLNLAERMKRPIKNPCSSVSICG